MVARTFTTRLPVAVNTRSACGLHARYTLPVAVTQHTRTFQVTAFYGWFYRTLWLPAGLRLLRTRSVTPHTTHTVAYAVGCYRLPLLPAGSGFATRVLPVLRMRFWLVLYRTLPPARLRSAVYCAIPRLRIPRFTLPVVYYAFLPVAVPAGWFCHTTVTYICTVAAVLRCSSRYHGLPVLLPFYAAVLYVYARFGSAAPDPARFCTHTGCLVHVYGCRTRYHACGSRLHTPPHVRLVGYVVVTFTCVAVGLHTVTFCVLTRLVALDARTARVTHLRSWYARTPRYVLRYLRSLPTHHHRTHAFTRYRYTPTGYTVLVPAVALRCLTTPAVPGYALLFLRCVRTHLQFYHTVWLLHGSTLHGWFAFVWFRGYYAFTFGCRFCG